MNYNYKADSRKFNIAESDRLLENERNDLSVDPL